MPAIPLSKVGQAFFYNSVPWANRALSLKAQDLQLAQQRLFPFRFERGGIPADCAAETSNLQGEARVRGMNACVRRLRGGGGNGGRRRRR